MASPPDSYEVYTTAISAAAVSTQIKAIESRLGLKARRPALLACLQGRRAGIGLWLGNCITGQCGSGLCQGAPGGFQRLGRRACAQGCFWGLACSRDVLALCARCWAFTRPQAHLHA